MEIRNLSVNFYPLSFFKINNVSNKENILGGDKMSNINFSKVAGVYEKTALVQSQYKLPVWFDRMGTNQRNREAIFKILNNLSSECKINYPFGNDYITTYRYEILASKN